MEALIEPAAEILVRLAWAALETALASGSSWYAARRVDEARLARARAFLDANAQSIRDDGASIDARLDAARGSARVQLDVRRGRVRIACAWVGPRTAFGPLDPRSAVLPEGLARLKQLGDIDQVRSDGRTLELHGGLALAADLDAATRVLSALARTPSTPSAYR